MNEILTYQQCFSAYPNQWVLLEAVTRDETNKALITGKVLDASIVKKDIIDKSKQLKKLGYDVAVITTLETLEEALAFVAFDNGLVQQDYVSPAEYAFMFNLYFGLSYNELYVEE